MLEKELGQHSPHFLGEEYCTDVQVKEIWHGYQMATGKTNQNFHSGLVFATDSVAFPHVDSQHAPLLHAGISG